MSRTFILTVAAAVTITVASFASSASYAHGFGGGGHASFGGRLSVGGHVNVGGRVGAAGSAGSATDRATPVAAIRAVPAVGPAMVTDTGFSVAVAGSSSTRWLVTCRMRPRYLSLPPVHAPA